MAHYGLLLLRPVYWLARPWLSYSSGPQSPDYLSAEQQPVVSLVPTSGPFDSSSITSTDQLVVIYKQCKMVTLENRAACNGNNPAWMSGGFLDVDIQ